MYRDFFGLRILPFEDRADAQFTYLTPELEETLATLEYQVRYDHGMALVVGDAGTGKTQLIRTLLLRLPSTEHAVVLTWCGVGQMGLLREVCKAFGVTIPSSHRSESRWRSRLRRHLSRSARSGRNPVLIIDQAANLSNADLKQVVSLAELQLDAENLLTILLAGQPAIKESLRAAEHAGLHQRLFGERVLRPLSADETESYIRHRLRVAGCVDSDLFPRETIEMIHQMSRGIPRLINRLGHQALLAAYGAERTTIAPDLLGDAVGKPIQRERTIDAAEVAREPYRHEAVVETPLAVTGTDGNAGRWEVTDDQDPGGSLCDLDFVGAGPEPGSASDEPAELPRQLESVFERGEALLDRLERALARADRMAGSTDASLTHMTAVEQHLTSLLAGGKRLQAGLGASIQQASEIVERIEVRSRAADAMVEKRSSELDTVESRVAEVSSTVNDRLSRIEDACRRAHGAERSLHASAEQLANQGDDVQQRIGQLLKTFESADQSKQVLLESIQRIQSLIPDAEQRASAITGQLQSHMQDLQKVSNDAQERVGVARTEIDRLAARGGEVVSDAVRQLGQVAEDKVKETQRGLDQLFERIMEVKERSVNEARCHIDSIIGKLRNDSQSILDETAKITEEQERLSENTGRMRRDFTQVEQGMREQVKRSRSVLRSVDKAVGAADSATSVLRTAVGDSEAATAKAAAMRGELQAAMEAVRLELGKADNVTGQLKGLDEQLRVAERLAGEMAGAQGVIHQLSRSAEHAGKVRDGLDMAAAAAAQQAVRIDSQSVLAARLVKELSAANANTHRVMRDTKHAAGTARAAAEQARAGWKQLTDTKDQGTRLATEMAELVDSAKTARDSLQEQVARAQQTGSELVERKTDASRTGEELDRRQVGAQQAADQLQKACAQGESIAATANDAARRCEEQLGLTVSRTEQILSEVGNLCDKTDEMAKRLEGVESKARRVLPRIEEATPLAEEVVRRLADTLEETRARSKELMACAGRANDMIERVGPVADALNTLKDVEAAVADSLQRAESIQTELTQTLDEAARDGMRLDELHAVSEELIHRQERLREDAIQARQSLEEHVGATRSAVSSGQELLNEFVQRAEQIQGDLNGISGQTSHLRETIEAATREPQEILERSRAQSKKLEKVCDAVRNVFARLSKAALEADNRCRELRATDREAGERLALVLSQTDRASHMLRRWADEALRWQTNMSGSADGVGFPPDGHSAALIRSATAAVDGSVAGVDAHGAAVHGSRQAPKAACAEAPAETVLRSTATRDQTIRQIIEEAKQAP